MSAGSSEQRTFIFSIVFILVFSALVATIPLGLQGLGSTADDLTAVNPSLVAGFSTYETYQYSNFTPDIIGRHYEYSLNSKEWRCQNDVTSDHFMLQEKIIWAGIIVVGYESVNFINENGSSRGTELTFTEIETDATDGTASYDAVFDASENTAGGFVVYWNTTAYPVALDAWGNDSLYITHGFGIESTAAVDMGVLLLDLLTLQLPEVPMLVNILLVAPLWACIIYLIWFIVKETLPFV
jgi:hypothetical protein